MSLHFQRIFCCRFWTTHTFTHTKFSHAHCNLHNALENWKMKWKTKKNVILFHVNTNWAIIFTFRQIFFCDSFFHNFFFLLAAIFNGLLCSFNAYENRRFVKKWKLKQEMSLQRKRRRMDLFVKYDWSYL